MSDDIAITCLRQDDICRKELEKGFIVSERDYVSNLTSRIRNILLHHSIFCHTQTIPGSVEQRFGVDGIFIFKCKQDIKIGIFEAKKPNLLETNYSWDYLTVRNTSHFSEQINKQRLWMGQFAIWEMFFNEGKSGHRSPPFESIGSTCIWHVNAYNHLNTYNLISNNWNTSELERLSLGSSINLYNVIFSILSCQQGKIYNIDKDDKELTILNELNEEIKITIPIPSPNAEENQTEIINYFLKENGLSYYTFIDLTNFSE